MAYFAILVSGNDQIQVYGTLEQQQQYAEDTSHIVGHYYAIYDINQDYAARNDIDTVYLDCD